MKALFCGLGSIGQRHCRNLRAKFGADIDIYAYRVRKLTQTITPDLDIEDDTDVNQKYGVHVFDDLAKALSQKPDVTFITNPPNLHIPTALDAAKSGSHVFVEKPLSHTLEGVDELISLCDVNHLVGYVAYQLRFHPSVELIKMLLASNALGVILSVHAEVGEYLPGCHKYEDYRQMFTACKNLGGGVILSQIHEFDYLYDWFGLPTKIFCVGGHLSSLEIDAEDTAKILLEFPYQGKALPVSVHMDYNQQPSTRGCKIIGEKGLLEFNFITGIVKITHPNGQTKIHDFHNVERNAMFTKELDHFFDCVENKSRPLISLTDGANSLRMALAAKESLETGRVVSLQEHVFNE